MDWIEIELDTGMMWLRSDTLVRIFAAGRLRGPFRLEKRATVTDEMSYHANYGSLDAAQEAGAAL